MEVEIGSVTPMKIFCADNFFGKIKIRELIFLQRMEIFDKNVMNVAFVDFHPTMRYFGRFEYIIRGLSLKNKDNVIRIVSTHPNNKEKTLLLKIINNYCLQNLL